MAEPSLLMRLGRFCARRARVVLVGWVVLVAGLAVANGFYGGTYADDVNLPGTSAQQGLDLLREHMPQAGGFTSPIVVRDPDGNTSATDRTALAELSTRLGALEHVRAVGSPYGQGGTVIVDVTIEDNPINYGPDYITSVDTAVEPARAAGLLVDYGGQLGQASRPRPDDRPSEVIGGIVALIVLLLGFGSVLAAALPLLSAVLGVGAAVSTLGLVAATVPFGVVSPTIAVMMGLGVGFDYGLLLATRYRRYIADGTDPVTAAGEAVARSGRAVLVAAVTIVVALLGLYASGLDFVGRIGVAAGISVAVAALAAVTLTPALLGLAGRRIDRWRVRRPVSEPTGEHDAWQRYANAIGRHPWWYLLAGLAVLGTLAVPVLSMQVGHVDAGAYPHSYTDRRAYDAISDAFGPGANGPLTVVVDLGTTPRAGVAETVRSALAGEPGVANVTPFTPSPDGALLVGQVVPTTGPQDAATDELFNRLLDTTLPAALHGTDARAYVTGVTAMFLELRDVLSDRLPLIIAVVVAGAFLLLLMVFRGLLVALKAAILNLLSIAASYGVLVAVFQWGWGSSLLGLDQTVPIESFVPMMLFAIVFGLSMDYEIFLLSRVREAWLSTADNKRSVALGLSATGRVITCAALIMASVFAAFSISENVVVKMVALGLAASVVIDATVVRLVLVPSTMYLFGRLNWWAPRWLDRILPHLDPDPTDHRTRPTREPTATVPDPPLP